MAQLKLPPPLMIFAFCTALATNASCPCAAAPSDAFFSIPETIFYRSPFEEQDVECSVDLFFHVEGENSLPATSWAITVRIDPLPGSAGSLQFDPPPLVQGEPNLEPSNTDPFIDFDRDFSGMSYGVLGDTPGELRAVSFYIEPEAAPIPPLDEHGNLTLPNGSGLVALPLLASPDVGGNFTLSFESDPELTGVSFATGLPSPNDVDRHPSGSHQGADIIFLVAPFGDYNEDGQADGEDLPVWQNGFSISSGAGHAQGDGDGDGDVDGNDFLVWQRQLGGGLPGAAATAVPEPPSLMLLVAAMLSLGKVRKEIFNAIPGHALCGQSDPLQGGRSLSGCHGTQRRSG